MRVRVVAALYIDPRGPYPKMLGVDCWDEARDARTYAGPHPVVAHPPCGAWGSLSHLHRRSDSDCALPAVMAVNLFGGVLEQPARSRMFRTFGLPAPGEAPEPSTGGRTYEVQQVAWGHVARKKTWLYVVGVPDEVVRADIRLGRTPTHWVSGGRKHTRKGSGGVVPPGIKVCSAQQRRRTPPAFAEWLVAIARSVAAQ